MIPFCKTTIGIEEKKAVEAVLDSGWVVMGEKTEQFESEFAKYVGSNYAVFVDSGTSALDLSLKFMLRTTKTKKVCVPSLTFTSTAEVVVNNGLKPCFHDVKKEDFCMRDYCADCKLAIPVHLTGNKSDLSASIYDSAHRVEPNEVKESSALWCYSFYATKNMTTIQGGMVATNSQEACQWLKKARDHGLSKGTKERYAEGKWFYQVEFVGWREKSDDLHAAVGIEQLKKLPLNNARRNEIVKRYNLAFRLNRTGNHLYPVLVKNRADFIEFMKEEDIYCSVHFLPLHKMPAYQKFAPLSKTALVTTEHLGDHLVSLPLYPSMTNEEIDTVISRVKQSNLLLHE